MVPSVVDFAPWDHGCCALKLVKLAAGSFEFDGAVADQQPSWTAVCSSTATGERNVTTNGLPLAGQLQPGDSDRSQWSRPWREARCLPTPRWEKSGPVPPRRSCLIPADDNVQQRPSPKQRVVVDLSSALVPSSIPPEYTTKYFGLVGGELGVMSKVDPLGPRPSSPGLWRATEAAVPSEANLERRQRLARGKRRGSKALTPSDTAPADTGSDAVGVGARAMWPGDAESSTRLPGSKDSSRRRRGEVFTAQEPPVTKPVEGPEPPPWSESRAGLLCEPSEGASLASIGAQDHGGSSTTTNSEDWGGAVDMVPETNDGCSISTTRGGRAGPSFESKSEDDDEDDSSAFALSFVSAPWAVSDDEGGEQAPRARQPRCRLWAKEITLPSTAAGAKNTEAVQAARRLAALQGAKRGGRGRARKTRVRDGGGGGSGNRIVESPAKPKSMVDSILQEDGGENRRGREVGITRPPAAIDNSKDNVSTAPFKPQPELYDVWIARDFFHGKGLPTGKRVRGGSEPRTPKGLKAAAATDDGNADTPTTTPASQVAKRASEDREPPGQPEQHHKRPAAAAASAGKRCAVRYVGGPEDFTGGIASGAATREGLGTGARSPQAAGRWQTGSLSGLEAADIPGATAAITGVGLQTGRVDDAGDADADDGHGNGPVRAREAEEMLDVSGDIVAWQADEEEEEGGVEGREGMEHEDEEYFDYAKRFSWQTAEEVVKEAEAEAEARSREQRRQQLRAGEGRDDLHDDTDDDVVGRQEGARQQLEVAAAAAAAAAASERARVRSDHATVVAVGRLRAPQSVFHRMHRTPSRPEMRRSVTRGRFSPSGRKLWRQSEGLSPRTGQVCLSPRRRGGGGGCGGVGGGGDWIVPSFSGGGALDWAELRPTAVATRRWGSADSAAFVNRDLPTANDDANGGGEYCNNTGDNGDRGVGALEEGNRGWGSADGTPFVNRNWTTAGDDANAGGYYDVEGTDRGVGAVDERDRPWGSADGTTVHRDTPSADGDTNVGDCCDAGGSDRGAGALEDEAVVEEQEGQDNELVAEQENKQREMEECDLSKSDPAHHGNSTAHPHEAGGISSCREAEIERGEEDHDDGAISMADDGRDEPLGGESACCRTGAAAEFEGSGGESAEDPDRPLSSTVRCLSYTVKIPWGGHN